MFAFLASTFPPFLRNFWRTQNMTWRTAIEEIYDSVKNLSPPTHSSTLLVVVLTLLMLFTCVLLRLYAIPHLKKGLSCHVAGKNALPIMHRSSHGQDTPHTFFTSHAQSGQTRPVEHTRTLLYHRADAKRKTQNTRTHTHVCVQDVRNKQSECTTLIGRPQDRCYQSTALRCHPCNYKRSSHWCTRPGLYLHLDRCHSAGGGVRPELGHLSVRAHTAVARPIQWIIRQHLAPGRGCLGLGARVRTARWFSDVRVWIGVWNGRSGFFRLQKNTTINMIIILRDGYDFTNAAFF